MNNKKQNKIYIIDVTNRDGVQAPRLSLAKLEKTIVNLYLDKLGIFQSEMGFPFTDHETNYINANLELVKQKAIKNLRLSGWCRAIKDDVKKALDLTKLKHLNLSIPTSDIMLKYKFRNKFQQKDIIKEMRDAVRLAYKYGVETVGVNAEDASRTGLDFLIKFGKSARKEKAVRLRYCDTIGFENPLSIYKRVNTLAKEVELPIELHCHNDLGMAVACSVIGAKGVIDAGQDAYINTTITGIGERAGNADLASILLALKYAKSFKNKNLLASEINLKMIWGLTKYVFYSFGVPIPLGQPGVGKNAFTHESGIHVDGVLKNKRNYELYDFEDLGRKKVETIETGRKITLGEYSGINGLKNVYEKLGIKFRDKKETKTILKLVRFASVHTQKLLTKEELLFIIEHPQITRQLLQMKF